MNSQRGFTLIEVLIAMAILAIALSAITLSISSHTRTQVLLKEKNQATVVARNVATQLALGQLDATRGELSGNSTQLGIQYQWDCLLTDSAQTNLRQVALTVKRANQVLTTFTTLVRVSQ